MLKDNYSEDIEPYDYKHNKMDLTYRPKQNFYRRLVEMYGEYYATKFYKERVEEEPPILEKKDIQREEGFIDLNNL